MIWKSTQNFGKLSWSETKLKANFEKEYISEPLSFLCYLILETAKFILNLYCQLDRDVLA